MKVMPDWLKVLLKVFAAIGCSAAAVAVGLFIVSATLAEAMIMGLVTLFGMLILITLNT